MKKISLIILMILSISICMAKENKSLGIAIGPSAGSGISYRTFNNESGLEINYIGIGSNTNFVIFGGAKYMMLLNSTEVSRFYYFGAGSTLTDISKSSDTFIYFNIGAGVGFEYTLVNNLRLSLDMPLTIWNILESDDRMIFTVIPDIGIHYYF